MRSTKQEFCVIFIVKAKYLIFFTRKTRKINRPSFLYVFETFK